MLYKVTGAGHRECVCVWGGVCECVCEESGGQILAFFSNIVT